MEMNRGVGWRRGKRRRKTEEGNSVSGKEMQQQQACAMATGEDTMMMMMHAESRLMEKINRRLEYKVCKAR